MQLQSWRAQRTYEAVGLPCTRVTVVRPAALLRSGHANGPLLKDGSPAVYLISTTLIIGLVACRQSCCSPGASGAAGASTAPFGAAANPGSEVGPYDEAGKCANGSPVALSEVLVGLMSE